MVLHGSQLLTARQWIGEVLHFNQGVPILLVGTKLDLRHDPKTIEELRKTSQKPVTTEEVSRNLGKYRMILLMSDGAAIGKRTSFEDWSSQLYGVLRKDERRGEGCVRVCNCS